MDCKQIQPVHPEGDQSWVFIGRTDVEAESPILWPPNAKSWLVGKHPTAGKDWGQEEKGTAEDEMSGWHHWLNGHVFWWTPGVGDRQGGLECCGSWGHKESDTTERLNWTELKQVLAIITLHSVWKFSKERLCLSVEAKILSLHKFTKLKWKEGTPIKIYSEMKSLCCKYNRIANVAADVWNRISQLKVLETFWDIVPEIILQNKYALLVLVSSHRKMNSFERWWSIF